MRCLAPTLSSFARAPTSKPRTTRGRGRVYAGDKLTFEGVLVPRFRRGTFDQLDEATSPFNLVAEQLASVPFAPPIDTIDRRTPPATLSNMQGGARASMTFDRVDLDVAAYRGFDS